MIFIIFTTESKAKIAITIKTVVIIRQEMKDKFRSGCPISSTLDLIGDKWSLLIIRDMLLNHKKTFKEMSASEERIAPSILSSRLKSLESHNLIHKTKLPRNRKENIYVLTKQGVATAPIILELTLWGDKYMRALTEIDNIPGLDSSREQMLETITSRYNQMCNNLPLLSKA